MKITKLKLVGQFELELPIVNAQMDDQYLCKGVDGLGPPDTDLVISNVQYQGGIFQNKKTQNREIVVLIGLNSDYSVATPQVLREDIYKLLTPWYNEPMTVQLINDSTVVAQTTCYVKRLEVVPFSKDPAVQLTLDCLSPYFSAPSVVSLNSTIRAADPMVFDYDGSAPTGIYFEATLSRAYSNVVIRHGGPSLTGNYARMMFNYSFNSGDILKINTNLGARSIIRTRGGADLNIIYSLVQTTDWDTWFSLVNGSQQMSIDRTPIGAGGGLVVATFSKVEFTPQYWGV